MALCQRATLSLWQRVLYFGAITLLLLNTCAVLSLYGLTAAIAGHDRAAHMSRRSRPSA